MNVRNNIKLSGFCEIEKAPPCGFVLFGASGDLAGKKLLPSLFKLYRSGRISESFFIVGFARTVMNENEFRARVRKSVKDALDEVNPVSLSGFASRCFYIPGGYDSDSSYLDLGKKLKILEKEFHTGGNIVCKLAVPPDLYGPIVQKLGINSIIKKGQNEGPYQRVMVEKPFGRDFESAAALNGLMLEYLTDEQIYRIDHYLGKNTVQNILVFRFANMIFEPVWDHNSIDHVQIAVNEDDGVGNRAGYFERAGLIRDILQNHLMQVLTLVAMEQPPSFDAESINDEKTKVLASIEPFRIGKLEDSIIRGQYSAGTIGGNAVPGYRDEPGVDSNSCVETYFASKLFINNSRWTGTPFYLRAGKRLKNKSTKIHIVFKEMADCLFCKLGIKHDPNILTFGIQPEQEVSLKFIAKVPGAKLCLSPLDMDFNYRDIFGNDTGGDYETVILDCMLGDQTLFWRKDGVEESWKLLTPVLKEWEECPVSSKKKRLYFYKSGGRGPEQAVSFIGRDGRAWID